MTPHNGVLVAALLAVVLSACEEKPTVPPPSRFAAVTKASAAKGSTFCDRSYPATTRAYVPAAARALSQPGEAGAKGWRWINAWATWCTPCIEEMGLLSRWEDAFARDGVPVSFELLSVDAEDAKPELQKWLTRGLPGQVKWVNSEEDFFAWLDGLGVDRDAAIPIHALVDPSGQLRCVRLGAVHETDYGAVKALLIGS